jgi:hypothetical protein
MKILFTPSDNNVTSGAFLSMVKLCSILQNDYKCDVLVLLHCKGTGEELLQQNNIKYKTITSFNWFIPYHPRTLKRKIKRFVCNFWMPIATTYNKIAIHKIMKVIKEENIDLVHINTSCTYVGSVAAIKTGTPYVWHIREFLEEDQERCMWNKRKAYELIANASKIITISESIYQKYEKRLKNSDIVKIYNGIDEEQFKVDRHELFEDSTIHMLIVGSINKSKGQDQAIAACKRLIQRGISNIELLIIGKDSKYSLQLKKQTEEWGLSPYIKFIGLQKDVAKFYRSADIVFMCSEAEAFGRVTVEAMISGCLVIGANSGATIELIENLKTGLLYENGNIHDLEDKLLYAFKHKNEARQMAEAGRVKMSATMTAANNAKQIYNIYKNILGENFYHEYE